jgi:primosomal protein N' (replication factor Y)
VAGKQAKVSASPLAAEVAVAVPVPGTFHYLVPENISDIIRPGTRVLVPFGPRKVTGYVLSLASPEDMEIKRLPGLKEIIAPLDDQPLFGESLIPLFRFASTYYHHPLGMVIAEALPAGLNVMTHKTGRLTESGRRALKAVPPKDAAVLMTKLNRPKGIILSRLLKDPKALSMFNRLKADGLAEVETSLHRERIRPKTEKWIHRAPDPPSDTRIGPKEKELLDHLEQNGPMAASDLSKTFTSLYSMAHRLTDKGQIVVEEREVFRDESGRAMAFDDHWLDLTPDQTDAVTAITKAVDAVEYAPFLIHGITGSGKTEVYLNVARNVLAQGRTVMFLVPEISLTPSLEGLLSTRFKEDVAVLHSGLSDGERYDQWVRIARGGVRIVLGARSAIFAPLDNLGLIVVDEEHDGAYKQEDKLRYQARDLALWRGRHAKAAVVLGSATPSVESFQGARSGRYTLLKLPERVGGGALPQVDVVDLRFAAGRRRAALTPVLKAALQETLTQNRQALIFINRRGLAGLPICLSCGFVIKCLNCSVTLTLHQGTNGNSKETLSCHHCGFEIDPPERCPECKSRLMRFLGMGTERLEKEIIKAYPDARVARLDADTTRPKGELSRMLKALRDRELDIMVGTQIVTKGHDFPNITLVGVIEADLGLHLPDFRASERTFQLLAQVSGRAGRGQDPGRVIVQTYSPGHYTLLLAQQHDYLSFFDEEIKHRRELRYPPFARLALLRFQGNSEQRTSELANEAGDLGREILDQRPRDRVDLLGPAPAPLAKIKGRYRYQILLRGQQVKPLHAFIDKWLPLVEDLIRGKGVSCILDVDPHHML